MLVCLSCSLSSLGSSALGANGGIVGSAFGSFVGLPCLSCSPLTCLNGGIPGRSCLICSSLTAAVNGTASGGGG